MKRAAGMRRMGAGSAFSVPAKSPGARGREVVHLGIGDHYFRTCGRVFETREYIAAAFGRRGGLPARAAAR